MICEIDHNGHLGSNWLLLQALRVQFAPRAKAASLPHGILGQNLRPFTALTSLSIQRAAATSDVDIKQLYQLPTLTALEVRSSWIKSHSMFFPPSSAACFRN